MKVTLNAFYKHISGENTSTHFLNIKTELVQGYHLRSGKGDLPTL